MASEVIVAREGRANPINSIRGGRGGNSSPIKTAKALSDDLGVKLPSKTKRSEDGSFSFEMASSSSYRSPQQKFEREFFNAQGALANPTFKHVDFKSESKGWNFVSDSSIGDTRTDVWEFKVKSGRSYRLTKVRTTDRRSDRVKYTFKEK